MKILLALCLVVAAVSADAPIPTSRADQLRYYDSLPPKYRNEVRDESNQFHESYGTHTGTQVEQRGSLKQTPDGQDYFLALEGSYRFVSPEGIPFDVTYIADENGFRPTGSHLPVAPVAPTS